MKDKKPNGAMDILKENAWAIALIVIGWIVGFALLQQQVTALEADVAKYPSQDWFDLKFEYIDQKLNDLEAKLD